MQVIDVPGVGEVEFPDEMGDAEILAAVQKLTASAAPAPPVSKAESAVRGGVQGASLGWGEEAAAAIDAAFPDASRAVNPDVLAAAPKDADYTMRYEAAKEHLRQRNREAAGANPKTYLLSQVMGAAAPTLVGGAPLTGARAMGIAAGQGAAQGAGYSDAASGRGLAGDTLSGTALGLTGYGAGQVLGKVAPALRRAASARMGLASARAGAQASKEVAEELASKAGQVGAETQKGSRYIENLMRLKESMTPEQQALYAQLEASGVVPALQQSVAQGTLAALPAQAATIAAKRAALEEASKTAGARTAERTGELLRPQIGADARSFIKAYGEPVAWAYGGNKIAEALGVDSEGQMAAAGIAGLIGGRTRAGKALMTRLTRPGNQAALARTLQALADRGDTQIAQILRRAIAAGAPAVASSSKTDEPKESK